jgi:hypothetical protein
VARTHLAPEMFHYHLKGESIWIGLKLVLKLMLLLTYLECLENVGVLVPNAQVALLIKIGYSCNGKRQL